MNKLKVLPTHDQFKFPIKGSLGASCFDCYVAEIVKVDYVGGVWYVKYNLGFALDIPNGYEVQLRPRSSNYKTNMILSNSMGTIDSDYTGTLFCVFYLPPIQNAEYIIKEEKIFMQDLFESFNLLGDGSIVQSKVLRETPFFKVGERCCQMAFQKVEDVTLELTDKIDKSTSRGGSGFGSTGK